MDEPPPPATLTRVRTSAGDRATCLRAADEARQRGGLGGGEEKNYYSSSSSSSCFLSPATRRAKASSASAGQQPTAEQVGVPTPPQEATSANAKMSVGNRRA